MVDPRSFIVEKTIWAAAVVEPCEHQLFDPRQKVLESDPERDFHAQPPPAKRQRQHMSRGLNQLLDSVEFHEVGPG